MNAIKIKNKFKAQFLQLIWPIEKHELSLFLPMAFMMFCILFNFGALRSLKDSLVIPAIGAEVISTLKLWLVLPSAILFTIIYAKLSNSFKFEYVFYIVTISFLLFFLCFAFILYPNQNIYHPHHSVIDTLAEKYIHLKWFIKLSGKWSYALMYILGELWSVVVINLMFWQFANQITDTKKARRFYPVLGMIGNLGLIAAGNTLIAVSTLNSIPERVIVFFTNNYMYEAEITIKLLVLTIVFVGVMAMMIFRYINNLISQREVNQSEILPISRVLEQKTRLSLKQSLKLVINSSYLRYILGLVICYGLTINILEGPWKAKIRELYPTNCEYMAFMGRFNIWLGISCVVFTVFGSNILRLFSWKFAALVTPIMIMLTGSLFFIFIVFELQINSYFGNMIFNPIYAAVVIGAIQNALSKASKYSLFDSTKEMTYIPLSIELRTKGKAAVEVVGTKLGKSMGAFIQWISFTLVPAATFELFSPYLMVIFIIVILFWIMNVNNLYAEYSKILPKE